MSERQPVNLVASVRQRLLNLSKERKEEFTLTLTRYAVERLLFRITRSEYGQQFVLKGAMLFSVWAGRPLRPTRDLDLLGHGIGSREELRRIFGSICSVQTEPDGLDFDPSTIRIEEIREDQEYQGQRVRLVAMLGNARIPVQVDVGFGDTIVPPPEEVKYPTLLGFPAPLVRAYPREAMVAEKLQAMVGLGVTNSRMKDFFDIAVLARTFAFEGGRLARAIQATFDRRKTSLPLKVPPALVDEFAQDPLKRTQWEVFLRKGGVDPSGERLEAAVRSIRGFVMPAVRAVAHRKEFHATWPPGGPWRTNSPAE